MKVAKDAWKNPGLNMIQTHECGFALHLLYQLSNQSPRELVNCKFKFIPYEVNEMIFLQ